MVLTNLGGGGAKKARKSTNLDFSLFTGHLADFVEDYSPDAVITSCLKGSFDFPDTK